jgi:cytochrome P450
MPPMSYLKLVSFLQEVLRLYAGLPFSERVATQDTVLRLSEPIRGKDGQYITEIEVKKGQYLVLAHTSYNRYNSCYLPRSWAPR